MVVQHNLTAINANRYFGINNTKLSKSLEKLSSGYAINRAGDNAAGLAVSEKMRAQISGINQGVKNAQDGISMVQTFEGALTETDSILQRMRTLATQSANGTYQNDVDREAIQLEYNQLNDELNQIADTDFNGVVVLNGGQMADGLKAVDGEFDYKQKAAQLTEEQNKALTEAQTNAQAKLDKAQAAYDKAKKDFDGVAKRDLSNNGDAAQWNTVDNSKYTKDAAKTLFNNADKANGLQDEDGNVLSKSADSADITFEADVAADGSVTWTATKGTYIDKKGDERDVDNLAAAIKTKNITLGTNGGFEITDKDGKVIGNAVFDASNLKKGDTITLTFTYSSNETYAPDNIAIDNSSLNGSSKEIKDLAAPTVTLGTKVIDDNMTQEMADALKELDDATISYEYDGKTIKNVKISSDKLTIEEDKKTSGKYNISYKNADGKDVTIASVTPTAGKTASKASGKDISVTATGVKTAANSVTLTYNETEKAWYNGNTKVDLKQFVVGKTDAPADLKADISGVVKGTAVDGDKLTLTFEAGTDKVNVSTEYEGAKGTEGTLSFGIAVDAFNYDSETAKPTIKAGANPDIDSSKTDAIDKKYYEAKEALSAAKAAYPKTYEDLGIEEGVSKSDSNNASTATLTYKDNVTLQVGARTKDSVNFTFKYDSNGLGDLEADLDCSARGLGTDKLSLATQESANVAIDKIDNALNKVSMVRGTFGAVQNRLEHKIDNLNTTSENLTSAESRIRDTNMAEEMMNFTKNQILSQASQSMLAQANQLPQGVLSLLQ